MFRPEAPPFFVSLGSLIFFETHFLRFFACLSAKLRDFRYLILMSEIFATLSQSHVLWDFRHLGSI
jgi:hypothetical protein